MADAVTSEPKRTAPPRPTLAIRLGVTGHRKSRLGPEHIERINNQVQWVLDCANACLKKSHHQYRNEYSTDEPLRYFVSALADGADTLAANCALSNNWRLLAPLPFSKEIYQTDFSPHDREEFETLIAKAHAIAELDGLRSGEFQEERAYLQAGLVTLDQSDILIAIWDGEEARGVGGTAMIKEEALRAGRPVIWINAVSDEPPRFLTAEGGETLITEHAISDAIDSIVAPPSAAEIEHAFSDKNTHARQAYHEYASERAHKANYGIFYQILEKAFALKWPFRVSPFNHNPEKQIIAARKSTLAQKLAASQTDQNVFNDIIIPRFEWADHLAIHYGNLYRSSYYFNYTFAAIAVFLALIDLVAKDYGIGSKVVWISIEVSLICMILMVTTAGKRGRWHEKWIDYRQLAEELRQSRLYFLTLGSQTQHDDLTTGEGAESAGWISWYMTATQREYGMTSGAFDADATRLIARTVLEEELRPQVAYHGRKADSHHSMEHRLHHIGEYAFGATLIVCLFYLTLEFLAGDTGDLAKWAKYTKYDVKSWVVLATAFLPAVGASLFGIRVQGEFGSTAERSHATAAQLKTIVANFEVMTESAAPRLENLRIAISDAARAMLMENLDWRLVYIAKPLNLPG